MKKLTVPALTAALLAASVRAAADPVCLEAAEQQAVTACPTDPLAAAPPGPHAAGLRVRSKLDERRPIARSAPGSPADPEATRVRDDRATRLTQRSLALLVGEIQQLETLLRSTGRCSRDRPQLLRRVAEDYVELESAAMRQGPASAAVIEARRAAIRHYSTLVGDYSGKPLAGCGAGAPGVYPALDEAYYYLAYEHELAGDTASARRVYLDLVQNDHTKGSRFVPNAYLAFGELFFQEAQSDPDKWDAARKAYEEVLKRPPPENRVYGVALYKLAYVEWNVGAFERALTAFRTTIEHGQTSPQLLGATKLAERARRDILPVYAATTRPAASAHEYLRPLAGGSADKALEMAHDLGVHYLDTGQYGQAVALFKDLLVRDGAGDRSCAYQTRVTQAVMAARSGDKRAILAELDAQVDRLSRYRGERHPAEQALACANQSASLLAETAMAWHLEAVGSGGQAGTKDPKTVDAAVSLYRRVLATFTAQELGGFTYPKLVREDWPTRHTLLYGLADLLYFEGAFRECGPAFDEVVRDDPRAADAPESARTAALCYESVYLAEHAAGADRAMAGVAPGGPSARVEARPLSSSQQAMLASLRRYACMLRPSKDAESQRELAKVLYAEARTYFEAGHLAEAAAGFRAIAERHASSDEAPYAAELYLESLYALSERAARKRPGCLTELTREAPRLVDAACGGEPAASRAAACATLQRTRCDAARAGYQRMVEEADRGAADARARYEEAGRGLFRLWDKYVREPTESGKPAQCQRPEELLANSARALQAGHLIAPAIEARLVLVDPRFKLDQTEAGRDALRDLGANHQAIAVYDHAAEWYERYARAVPSRADAGRTLSDAVVLRLGLGHADLALDDAKAFASAYGARLPRQAAAIQLAVAGHHAERGDFARALSALQAAAPLVERAPLDVQLQAHALQGRAHARLGHAAAARAERAAVRALFAARGGQLVALVDAAYPDEDAAARERRVGRALEAQGEALFEAAEEARAERVDPLKFPAYAGSGTVEDVSRHIQTKVKEWLDKKVAEATKVDAEYQRVTALEPRPPPRWVIAAASRAGLMWSAFADELKDAPIPFAWQNDRRLKAAYTSALDPLLLQIRTRYAKPALKRCLDQSIRVQFFDEHSAACESWLARYYRAEYHAVDELRDTATRPSGGLVDRPPPLSAPPPPPVAKRVN